jgi:hypothetical protein
VFELEGRLEVEDDQVYRGIQTEFVNKLTSIKFCLDEKVSVYELNFSKTSRTQFCRVFRGYWFFD